MRTIPLNRFHYLSPDGLKFYFWKMLQSHTNLGIPPVKFIEDSGPQQHGTNVRDWRINPRTIAFEFFDEGKSCCETRGELLAKMIDSIRPNRGTRLDESGWLRFVNDDITMMEIPVFVLQGPTGNFDYRGEIGKYQVQDSLQFYAPDPIWREVEKQIIVVGRDTWGESCIPCLYSPILPQNNDKAGCMIPYTYIMQNIPVQYDGTWVGDQIDITLTGPMETPTITNTTTGKQIQLNYNIPSGEYVIITIRPEYTTVLDQDGNNLIATVTSISDLVDFELATSGAITETGLNYITVAALGSDLTTTEIKIEYYTRHISAYGRPKCS